MKLYVIRHAEASAEKKLTERGEKQAKDLGRYLLLDGHQVDLILSSPVLRAQQTASLLAEAAKLNEPLIESWLSCGMHPEVAKAELLSYVDFESVAIVGHQPDLSCFLQSVLKSEQLQFAVTKASLTIIDDFLVEGKKPKFVEHSKF